MNLSVMRRLYSYHFALSDQLWDSIDHLTDTQFVQEVPYSLGSVRNHMVHLMSVDQRWLAIMKGPALPEPLHQTDYLSRNAVRAGWDVIQTQVKAYVMDQVTDADLVRPVTYTMAGPQGEAEHTNLIWEILVHMVNHGTDHRAQVLRLLHDFGAPTFGQGMMSHWWTE